MAVSKPYPWCYERCEAALTALRQADEAGAVALLREVETAINQFRLISPAEEAVAGKIRRFLDPIEARHAG